MDYFSLNEGLVAGLAAFGALVFGILLGRRGHNSALTEVARLSSDLARSEAQSREQTRVVSRMLNEQRILTNLFREMPEVVGKLNRSDLDPQEIPRLLFRLAESIFEPRQILLYLVSSTRDDGEKAIELELRAAKGLGEVPVTVRRIRGGLGKIGWVAENKVEMVGDDWLNLSRTEGRNVEDNHPALRLDLIGPLLHHGGDAEELLGVFCVGEPAIHPRDEKLKLQMLTNLGSIAYKNARNVRKLREQANHDGLTGLLNRRHFMVEVGDRINRAERTAQALGIFIFDIDHFKSYNDSNGHLAGDEILRGLARVLAETLRPGDVACRYGGEEFVVAMPSADGEAAYRAAERIREAIATHRFPHGENQPEGKLTISGGVAAFPVDGTSCTDLIRYADQALYQAKAAGRNRVILYKGVDLGDPDRDHVDWIGEPSEIGRETLPRNPAP